MGWFMRYVKIDNVSPGTRNDEDSDRPEWFESVKLTEGSWDGGRDVVCETWNRRKYVLQCKNYASAVSSDLLFTMRGKLEYSASTAGKKELGGTYQVAIAAVFPKFANPTKARKIEKWITDSLNHRAQTDSGTVQRLYVLEWQSEVGSIKDALEDFIRTTQNRTFLETCLQNRFTPPPPSAPLH